MAKLTKFKAQQVEFGTHYKIEETNRGDAKIKSITPAFGNIREPGTPETEEIYNGLQLGNVHTLQAIKSTNLNIDYYICNLEGLTEFGLNNDLKLRITVDNANTNATTKLRLNNVDYTLLKEQNGTLKQIEAGDIHSNKTYELIYNGSQFVVINLFKNFENSYLDDYIKKTDLAEENKAGIITLSAVKGLIPNATEYKNGTVNLRQINNAIDTKVPNATSDTAGKVMLGTTANTALEGKRLAEILGIEFGGNIQDVGTKVAGKFYYDKTLKHYYECTVNNALTYNDGSKFRAISNKPISDRLEKLVGITETVEVQNSVFTIVRFWRYGKRAFLFVFFDHKNSREVNWMTEGIPLTNYPANFIPDTPFLGTEHIIISNNNLNKNIARLVLRNDKITIHGVEGMTHYEIKGIISYITK